MREKIIVAILMLGIFGLATFFRFYGVNWDQNLHLHPDERFLTMVAGAISWPRDIYEYLDTATSPLNPHNRNFGFFVYGTFPIFFTKWVAELFHKADYNGLTIVGRQLSAVFDLGTVVLVLLIAKQVNKFQITNTKLQINTKSQIPSSKQFRILNLKNWKLFGNWNLFGISGLGFSAFPFLSMFLYASMVLPIQLSHFFAVDTYLTFFLTLSFYLLTKIITAQNSQFYKFKMQNSKLKIAIQNSKMNSNGFIDLKSGIYLTLLGISFGLAVSSKISAILFLPIIGLSIIFALFNIIRRMNHLRWKIFNFIFLFFIFSILFFISSYLTVRLAQPYLFAKPDFMDISLNQKVLDNWKQLKSFDNPEGWFPPATQWIKTKPYIFPLKNMVLWGMGLPIGIISILAISYYVLRITYYVFKRKLYLILNTYYLIRFLILLWIILFFTYQGSQFVKAMRYFYPLYPFLALISGYFVTQLFIKYRIGLFVYLFIGLFIIIYPLSFLNIYSNPHTRVAASRWIYQNIPKGSTLPGEHWDDALPMSLDNNIHEIYKSLEFPLYGADTREKWLDMDKKLKQTDYIILTSNRLYGSIMTFPERFPITNKYYSSLFAGTLGFTKIAEFSSRPNLFIPFIQICLIPPGARYGTVAKKTQDCPLPGISFVDDYADETFTVYDHPKVIVFKKTKSVDYFNLLYH